jgi:hypothetical protein
MRTKQSRVIAIGAFVSFAAPACSLVSGWSDLQGGQRVAVRDGGGVNDGASGDGATDVPPGPGTEPHDQPVTCGAASCPAGEGCCLDFGGGEQCSSITACRGNTDNSFLSCTSASACSAGAPVCCYDFSTLSTTCRAGCGPGNYELCNAAEPKPCTSGTSCTATLPGTQDIPICQ